MSYCCFIPNRMFAAFSNMYSLSSCGVADKSIHCKLFLSPLTKHRWKQKRKCNMEICTCKISNQANFIFFLSKCLAFPLKKCWKGFFIKYSYSKEVLPERIFGTIVFEPSFTTWKCNTCMHIDTFKTQ